jgi:hypothetical protein
MLLNHVRARVDHKTSSELNFYFSYSCMGMHGNATKPKPSVFDRSVLHESQTHTLTSGLALAGVDIAPSKR